MTRIAAVVGIVFALAVGIALALCGGADARGYSHRAMSHAHRAAHVHAWNYTVPREVTPGFAALRRAPALNVAPAARSQFEGLVADFQSMGYSVGTPGCLSAGHMARSKHHWGGACDLFNQVARNVTALRQPPPAVQIAVANAYGLTSGCVWRSPDCGHFEVPSAGAVGYTNTVRVHYYSHRVTKHRYASLH